MDSKTIVFDKSRSLELKGIAIILMLFHHCFRIPEIFKGYSVSFYPFQEATIVNVAYASKICVSFFAFVTGYGLFLSYSDKKESAQRWAAKRYFKTFSGYWFIWIISALVCQLIDGQTYKTFFSGGLSKGIIYCVINFIGLDSLFNTPTQNGTWWYMGAAVVFIISIPCIYQCKDNLGLLLVGTILMPRMLLRHDGSEIIASGTAAFAFFVPLILGCIFARYDVFKKISSYSVSSRMYMFLVEIWGIAFLYKIYHYLDRGKFWEIHYGLFPLLCIILLVENAIPINGIRKLLMMLGKHSMNMYLIHTFILRYMKTTVFLCQHFLS